MGLHESVTSHSRDMRHFEATRLFREDDRHMADFRFAHSDSFVINEEDGGEELRLTRIIAADAGKAACSFIRMKKANKTKLTRTIGLLSNAEPLAAQSNMFVKMAATLSWAPSKS